MQAGLAQTVQSVDLGSVLQQELHHVVVRLVSGQVKGSQEILVLLVQMTALPAQSLHHLLPLWEGRGHSTVEATVPRVGLLEVDHVHREELLQSAWVPLPAALQQAVALELCRESLLQVPTGRHVDCRLGVAVEQGGVGPVREKERTDLSPGLAGRLVEWSELPQVHGVHVGPVLDEQLRHLEVSVTAGVVERNQAAFVLRTHVSSVLEEELNYPGPVVSRGQVERGGLPPVTCVAVHVKRSQQGQQFFLVTTTSRL